MYIVKIFASMLDKCSILTGSFVFFRSGLLPRAKQLSRTRAFFSVQKGRPKIPEYVFSKQEIPLLSTDQQLATVMKCPMELLPNRGNQDPALSSYAPYLARELTKQFIEKEVEQLLTTATFKFPDTHIELILDNQYMIPIGFLAHRCCMEIVAGKKTILYNPFLSHIEDQYLGAGVLSTLIMRFLYQLQAINDYPCYLVYPIATQVQALTFYGRLDACIPYVNIYQAEEHKGQMICKIREVTPYGKAILKQAQEIFYGSSILRENHKYYPNLLLGTKYENRKTKPKFLSETGHMLSNAMDVYLERILRKPKADGFLLIAPANQDNFDRFISECSELQKECMQSSFKTFVDSDTFHRHMRNDFSLPKDFSVDNIHQALFSEKMKTEFMPPRITMYENRQHIIRVTTGMSEDLKRLRTKELYDIAIESFDPLYLTPADIRNRLNREGMYLEEIYVGDKGKLSGFVLYGVYEMVHNNKKIIMIKISLGALTETAQHDNILPQTVRRFVCSIQARYPGKVCYVYFHAFHPALYNAHRRRVPAIYPSFDPNCILTPEGLALIKKFSARDNCNIIDLASTTVIDARQKNQVVIPDDPQEPAFTLKQLYFLPQIIDGFDETTQDMRKKKYSSADLSRMWELQSVPESVKHLLNMHGEHFYDIGAGLLCCFAFTEEVFENFIKALVEKRLTNEGNTHITSIHPLWTRYYSEEKEKCIASVMEITPQQNANDVRRLPEVLAAQAGEEITLVAPMPKPTPTNTVSALKL